MAYSQGHLDALKEAYASGVTEVTYEGKTVRYRTLAELQTAINAVQAEINRTSGTAPAPRTVRLTSRRNV